MTAKQIQNINEILIVMKHFIDLSAKLLPFLDEMQHKNYLTHREFEDSRKIINVYARYNFDPQASKLLLNSNILELIKDSFEDIAKRNRHRARRKLHRFFIEYRRLSENWVKINAN